MDEAKFGDSRTGRLVRISTPVEDYAFIPDNLPPASGFPERLWPLLADAKEALGRLDGIGRTIPDPGLLLRPLQNREALRSSSLEGTYATPEQLLLYEMDPREPRSERDKANEWREVGNYGRALTEGSKLLDEMPICLRLIRSMHKTLLSGVRGRDKAPGEFRRCQVHIGSDCRYIPPPPHELLQCLDSFEKHLHESDERFDPLVRCYIIHYQFEAIHPFVDGNGRVGRLLLALLTYRWCQLSMPWLYMSAFFERYKDEYVDNLFRVSTEGDWERWLEFCLRGTIEQANDATRRCELLGKLRRDYDKRVVNGSKRAHAIVAGLFENPIITIPRVSVKYDITYPTAKSDVLHLIELGILVELPDFRPKKFYAPEVFEIAYSEDAR